MPPTSSSIISHSPVWIPARISIPSGRISSAMAQAQRTPRAGPSKVARMPSPVDLTSRPRNRATIAKLSGLLCRTDDVSKEHRGKHAVDRDRRPRARQELLDRIADLGSVIADEGY